LLFGCLFWVVDAVFEYYRFAENLRFMLFHEPMTFGDSLVWNIPPHALFTRLVFMAACLAAGMLVAAVATRHHAAQQALRESEERYRRYIRNAPDAVFILDDRARYVEVNQAACELTGFSANELAGMGLTDLLTRDQRPAGMRRFQTLRETGKVSGESAYRTKDGHVVDVSLDAVRLDEDRYIAFIKDITESCMLQDQLRQAQKLESIGQLAGGVAHDFNNLLTGVLGNAQLIELGLDPGSPLMPMAEQISQAATRAADLTKQLLGFARRGRIQTVEVDVHALIAEVADLLAHSIDRRIEIRTELNADRPVVSGDPSGLQNALLNLGVNSRDAMPEGGTLSFTTRNVTLDEEYCRQFSGSLAPGEYIETRVEDTGVGMTPDVQKRIFEPFFTTKRQGQGTGLGLAGAYGTVRSHNGLLRV
jgi:PAS domain S-box-containing protein